MLSCLYLGVVTLFATALAPWRDPSPHRLQFVAVENGVRLEVLDWGGAGRPLVLLAGGGNTAHIFDDFAPKLAATHHVYGITRRGFGASGFATSANPVDRLRDDVLAVIDSLKINRPVLVGHSIAGAEMSRVALSNPNRIAGLVYLEAGYPYAFDNGRGPSMEEFQQVSGPQPPAPAGSDLVTFASLQKWDAEVFGFRIPEAEFRQTWESNAAGRPVKARESPGSQSLVAIMTSTQKCANIPVPSLAIFAIPHVRETWMSKAADPAVRQAASVYFTKLDNLAEKQAQLFQASVPTARVIRLRGLHYIFLSNEAEVLRVMQPFLAGLK